MNAGERYRSEAPTEGAPVCEPDPLTGRCATCADEARPAVLLELLPGGLARAALPEGTREISVELLDDACPGDTVLVHAGIALTRLE